MAKFICVYSSSSCAIEEKYFRVAKELGREMAYRGIGLVFGGGMVGLMGETARTIHAFQGQVIGVIPKALNLKGIAYEKCDQLIVTEDMRERKATMEEKATGFIALPGGFGTLEELLEIITLKQLGYHNKPVVILNVDGFYDGLIEIFEKIINLNFAKKESRNLYFVANDVASALDYIETYQPQEIKSKWLTEINKPKKLN